MILEKRLSTISDYIESNIREEKPVDLEKIAGYFRIDKDKEIYRYFMAQCRDLALGEYKKQNTTNEPEKKIQKYVITAFAAAAFSTNIYTLPIGIVISLKLIDDFFKDQRRQIFKEEPEDRKSYEEKKKKLILGISRKLSG